MWKWIKALNPFESDNYHPWMREEIEKLKRQLENGKAAFNDKADRVEELRAQLAQAEIELADKAFYVREFAAVSAERDGLKKRNDVQAEQLIRIDSEISPLMSEVAELKAERDAALAERDEINKNYMGLVDLLLPYLRAAQAEAAARAALEGE